MRSRTPAVSSMRIRMLGARLLLDAVSIVLKRKERMAANELRSVSIGFLAGE